MQGLRPWTGQLSDRCDIENEGSSVAVICDHHSSRYGLDGLGWMRTLVVISGMRNSARQSGEVLLYPSSVVARGYREDEYHLVSASRLIQDPSYANFWSQQGHFIDELETYLVRNQRLSR